MKRRPAEDEATAAFERRAPALRGRLLWTAGLIAGAVLAVMLVTGYAQGRAPWAPITPT